MQIQPDLLKNAISKAREISDIYNLNYIDNTNPIRTIDTLKDICEKDLDKTIIIKEHEMQYNGHPFRGFYLAFNKDGKQHYEIVILGGQNYCWKRLVVCKELFHVILDDDECRNKNIRDSINEATNHLRLGNGKNIMPNPSFQTELLAEIAAMEFLFPYKERKKKLSILDSSEGNPSFANIAEEYKIPRYYVDQYLSDNNMSALKDF